MHYQYDGSFTGFLSAVYQAYHDGTSHVEKIESIFAGRSLFSDGEVISSNFDNAEKVINSLCKKIDFVFSVIILPNVNPINVTTIQTIIPKKELVS